MLVSSGAISLGGSTASRSINLELGSSATGQIDINNYNVRHIPGLTTADSTIAFSDFYGRLAFRRGAAHPTDYLWELHAASSNGSIVYLVSATSDLYKSTDYGFTATYVSTLVDCTEIDCSSNGAIVVYTSYTNGVYVSTNYGASFTLRISSALKFYACSCSESGALMVASAQNTTTASQLYVSTNSGTNWTPRGPSLIKWGRVTCSGASTYMYATNYGTGYIYRSSDSGTNWSTIRTIASSNPIACSSNGSIVWGQDNYSIYTRGVMKSTDYGASWSIIGTYDLKSFVPLRCSGDGTKIICSDSNMTFDGGSTWVAYILDGGSNIQGSVTRDGSKAFLPFSDYRDYRGYGEMGVAYLT